MLTSLFFSDPPTRFLLFTGKGGVGKTTLASATAVALADAGRRVLLVSTDPASNLNDVLRVSAGHQPTPVPEVDSLFVVNVDPEAAASAYRERVVAPYRIALPEAQVRALEEQLSGQCTVEVAAFDEFTRLLVDPAAEFDHVVFDTAPTGHTLRLLSLPSAWSTYLQTSTVGASCLGPLAGLEAQRTHYEAAVAALADPAQTTLVLVSRPDRGDLREAARASQELAALGIRNQRLALNGVFADPLADDRVAEALAQRQREALEAMPEALRALPRDEVPLTAGDLIGLAALRGLARDQGPPDTPAEQPTPGTGPPPLGLGDLVRELSALGPGAVLVMGKGGVGKTTIACAVALGLVRLGHEVDLSTTDPAGRWEDSLTADVPSGLAVSRLDPAKEVERYARERLDAAGELDPQQRALLEEDLRSPCTQEIAVFGAFWRTLRRGAQRYVVLDTAPTGHTLLLLDTAGAYHREVMRSTARLRKPIEGRVITPLIRLQDPDFTRLLIVTLPEATPISEAAQLQEDLRRAGIEPYGWVVNGSLAASGTRDPLLSRRAHLEVPHLRRVAELAARVWVVPWCPDASRGVEELAARPQPSRPEG